MQNQAKSLLKETQVIVSEIPKAPSTFVVIIVSPTFIEATKGVDQQIYHLPLFNIVKNFNLNQITCSHKSNICLLKELSS